MKQLRAGKIKYKANEWVGKCSECGAMYEADSSELLHANDVVDFKRTECPFCKTSGAMVWSQKSSWRGQRMLEPEE